MKILMPVALLAVLNHSIDWVAGHRTFERNYYVRDLACSLQAGH